MPRYLCHSHAGHDAADLYLKELSACPVTKDWNKKEMDSFGIGASFEEAIPDKKTLETFETVLDEINRKYAYHWPDRNGKLLVRWDNAPDWAISTFPHHKHMGEEHRFELSYERTLEQVMPGIAKRLVESLN